MLDLFFEPRTCNSRRVLLRVLELPLDEPPASVERQGDQWRARCERCDGHSKGYPRISAALAAQHRHGRGHVARDIGDLTVLLDTTRHPLEVRRQVRPAASAESRTLVHTSPAVVSPGPGARHRATEKTSLVSCDGAPMHTNPLGGVA